MDYWFEVLLIIGSIALWITRQLRRRAAQSWPIADGTIEMHTARTDRQGFREVDVAEINYSFQVEGKFYSGAHPVGREKEFDVFPKLSRVVVRYNPSDPEESYLDREDVRRKKELAKMDKLLGTR